MSAMLVEIVIRSSRKDAQERLSKEILDYMVFESDEKIVFNVPADWIGFKDGTIIDMLKEFGENMYAALAYFSMDEGEFVTDYEGRLIDLYEAVFEGKKAGKFIKKKIQILKTLDKDRDIFTVDRYAIDIKFTNPIINVMKLYSDASNGGLSSKGFLQ